MRGTLAVVVVLGGLLAAAASAAWWVWSELADVQMGMHGWIALSLGAGVAILLGVGLMYLVYYSSRHGYDDEVGRD
jgi:hypothetical protein